ncbi:MAG: ribonuclease J [Mycoplasmoidaceae bacterium]
MNNNDLNKQLDDSVQKNTTYLFAMGGLGEIGKNMYCIQYNDEIIIIDTGIKFTSGHLGMNGMVPNFQYLKKGNYKMTLIITHGHEDHIGGVPYLLTEVKNIDKIYASILPVEMIKKKLSEFKNAAKTEILTYEDDTVIQTENFKIDFFRVCHSIPDSYGVSIETPDGIIASAGDFRFDFGEEDDKTDIHKIAEISKRDVCVFLGESTNSDQPSFSESETAIIDNLKKIIRNAKGRILLSTFASNLGRIEKIVEIALKLNKKICLIGRSMENNIKTSKKVGLLNISELDLISSKDLDDVPDNEVLILLTGSQGEERAALSQISNGTHSKILIKESDVIILSSNPIPGNYLSVEMLVNKLSKTGATIIKHDWKNRIHASGHATAQEQQLMLKLMNPKYLVPIHGEIKMLKSMKENASKINFNPDNVFIIKNGDFLKLKNKTLSHTKIKINTNPMFIDGRTAIEDSELVLEERKIISSKGIFNIIIVVDKKDKKITNQPSISTRGCFYVKDSIGMISKIAFTIREEIEKEMETINSEISNEKIEDITKNIAKYFIWKNKKVNPLIVVTIFEKNKT